MKKLFFALIFIASALFIGSCGAPDGQQASTVDPLSYFSEGGERVTLVENGKSEYTVYYGSAMHSSVSSTAKQISDLIYSKCRAELDFLPFSDGIDQSRAVIYGKSSSPLSERLYDAVSSYGDNHTWGIAFEGGTLAVCASTKTAIEDGEGVITDLFDALGEYITDGTFSVPDGLFRVYTVTLTDYERLIEEKLEAEREELKVDIINKLATEFFDSDFDIYGTGITESMSEAAGFSYPSPGYYPTLGEHPRVLFTKEDIPGIREALDRPESSAAKMKLYTYINDRSVTGILGDAVQGSGYYHNYSYHALFTALNKAFAYAVLGDELCGLEAVYIYMNFLKTLDWYYKSNDQCREFGFAMYVGACVYDWCYDLISDENKDRIVMGIEQVLCTGKSKMPDKASFGGVKMEIGFPPTVQGSVDGHGSERQLLQQYLAISIAIYDEYPDWYEFCAGRIYEDYVDVRNAYYESGMIPQGTYYNGARYISDCYSTALLVAATGNNPYVEEDMHRSYYGIVSYRKNISGVNEVFYVGDCRPVVLPNPPFNGLSLIISHLFSDPVARGIAYVEKEGFTVFSEAQEKMSVAEYFIFSSGGVETSTDPASELALISYFGGYRGEIVARSSWTGDDSAAIVIMKVQERSTANHEHQAAGTFQIHYKGILSGDMGQYGGQTTEHVRYFHSATVSHNGLLVYNPAQAASNQYYTGGQRNYMSAGFDYDAWMSNPNNDTGTVISHKEGYTQSGDAKFAYIDGDITEAYDTVTVDYIARKMLTVFTGDEERPMIMFVFDRIDADSPEFKKTFLLQVPTEQAPVIDEVAKTVEINNGKGKLLLTNILGCDTIEALGGTDAEGNRLNYIVNGEQLSYGQGTTGDGNTWGRVELLTALGNKTDLLFNVIEVADADVDFTHSIKRFSALDAKTESETLFEGVTVGNISALFATAQSLVSKSFKFSTEGDGISEFYVCGLYCGTWTVKIDGTRCGTVYSTKDGGAVSFKAPLGTQIELVPGDDIRPENSGEITYVTNLGVFSKKPIQFYAIGVQTPLPTDITRSTDEFLGWYDNPDFEGEPITHIPESAGEKFTVYANWKYSFADEDYTSAELDRTKISYGGIAVIKPEGYLLWQTEDQGPSIQCVVNEFSAFGSTDGVISYELELAKNGDDAPIGFYLRIRDNCEKRHELMLLFSDAQGNVYFGSDYRNTEGATPLFTLSNEFQTVRILINFNEGKIYAYDADGRVERSQSFSISGHASALEFAEGVNEILGIRANNKGTLRIGKIKIADGNIFDKPLSGNKVNYVTNGGGFAENPPISYTPGERFVLSDEVTREGFAFLGWYTDKELTEKVTEIPQSTEGVFTVYAKWALSLVADYSDGTLSDVFTYNKTNASHTVDEGGALVWTTRAANPTVYALANGDISYAGASRVTIEISLSKKADDAPIVFNARMRDACSPRCAINLFSSDSSGAIYLGYNSKIKLFDLSETMTTLRVTVDFEAKTLSAYDASGTLHTLTFSYSGTHASADDFAASVNELLGFWAGSAGSLRIGQVKITAE